MANPPIRILEVSDALIEGESETYIVDFSPEGTPSAATAAIFIKGESTDLASVIFSGGVGTCTMNGALATLPLLVVRSGDGNKIYRIVVAGTIGTRVVKKFIEIPVASPSGV